MSVSPFKTTTGPFVEVPVPVTPDSLAEAKKDLEDIPFDAEIHEFPLDEEQRESVTHDSKAFGWFQKLFAGRAERRLREDKMTTELQDLRASYAGLLHSTEDIKDRLLSEEESRQSVNRTVTQALSPFPAAVAGLEKLQTRQEEASEILGNIRQKLDTTADRDESLLSTMDSVHGGVGELQSGVGVLQTEVGVVHSDVKEVSVAVSEIAAGQLSASASLGNFGEKMEAKFEEAAQVARANAERQEQSSEDVIQVLRQMEKNSQRSLWVFASLIAVLFVALIMFSAKMSQFGSAEVVEPQGDGTVAEEMAVATDPAAEVLADEFQF